MSKKYELIHEVGSTVDVPVVIEMLDRDNDVHINVDGEGLWLSTEQALKLGLIKEAVRKPQVGDVYKDSAGWVREIVALSKDGKHVWYWGESPSGRKDPHGTSIESIEDHWGELQ